MIKPIETVYNGYRFRSRSEARWAVFFDTLGVKWEYEKEGYDLDGIWYLPDFWLSELKRWVEIKGQNPTDEELSKIEKLHHATGYPACLFYGLPGENVGFAHCTCSHSSNAGANESDELEWKICPVCYSIDVTLRCHSNCSLYSEVDGIEVHNSCIYSGGTDCLDGLRHILKTATTEIYEKLIPPSEKIGVNPWERKDKMSDMLFKLAEAEDRLNDYYPCHPRLIAAYDAARQARFER